MTEIELVVRDICDSINSMSVKMESSLQQEIEFYRELEEVLKSI